MTLQQSALFTYFYSAPARDVKYCDQLVCVSVSVCLSLSQNHTTKFHPVVVYMLTVSVARSSPDGSAIYVMYFRFVDDVMFSHNRANGQNRKLRICFVEFARWRHRWEGRSLPSSTASSLFSLVSLEPWVWGRWGWKAFV